MDAQIPATCHFCEISTEIKWKCLHCKLFLCRLCCSKIHSKITFTDEHTIVDLQECSKEAAIDIVRKFNFQKMLCSFHENRISALFCKDCDQPVCSTCIVKAHKQHALFELDEMYKMKMTELGNLKTTVESNLSFFAMEEEDLTRRLSNETIVVSNAQTFISSQQRHLHQVLQSHTKTLLDEIDRKWTENHSVKSMETNMLMQQKTSLLALEKNIDHALNSVNAINVFNTTKHVINLMPVDAKQESHEILLQFKPTEIRVETLMCDIFEGPSIVQSHTTQLKSITNVIHLGNDTVIICSNIDEVFQEIMIINGEAEIVNVINDILISDMSLAKNDNHVVLSAGVDIKIFTESKQLKTILSLDYITLCVHVTKENDILIGAIHVNPRLSENKEQGVVLRWDKNVDVQQIYGFRDIDYDKTNNLSDNKTLRRPSRILKHLEEMVIVDNTDFTTYRGRILALTPQFDFKWEYTGSSSLYSFCPFDIACTASGLILITDIGNKSVHVLNGKGELVSRDLIGGMDILNPVSLHIDMDCFLWIGCETYMKDEGAKLYCIKI